MSILRLIFAGQVKRAEAKQAGAKQVLELSICKTHKAKTGEIDPTYTWARITVWEPQPWQIERAVVSSMVAGIGDAQLRSYTKKDGTSDRSLEVRCTSFDLEVQGDGQAAQAPARQPDPGLYVPPKTDAADEPPF
jgi:single-stranded DNA-binding protein